MIRISVKRTSQPFDLDRALRIIVDEFAKVGEETARSLISGQTPTSQLRRDGHPYGRKPARRGGRGGQRGTAPLLPINIQSGDLWRHLYVPRTANGFTISFPNTPSAWVLTPGGTKNAVARGFWPTLHKALIPQLRKAAKEVVPNAIAQRG